MTCRRCPALHLLDIAEPINVHAECNGRWFCNVCRGVFHAVETEKMWRCVGGCNFDCCSACIDDEYAELIAKSLQNSISLKMVSQDGYEVFVRSMTTTPLQQIMQFFCASRDISPTSSVCFLFDGTRIQEQQSPADCEMEDGDIIDVMVAQG